MDIEKRLPMCIISIIDDYADNIIIEYLIAHRKCKSIKNVNECNLSNICDFCFKYDNFPLLEKVIEDNPVIFDLEYSVFTGLNPYTILEKIYYNSMDKALHNSCIGITHLSRKWYNWIIKYSHKIEKILDRTREIKENNILAFSLCARIKDGKSVIYTLIWTYSDRLNFYLNRNISTDYKGFLTFDKLVSYDDIYETICPFISEEDEKEFCRVFGNINTECRFSENKEYFIRKFQKKHFLMVKPLLLKYGWITSLYKFRILSLFDVE
jgi:hypothetical protein